MAIKVNGKSSSRKSKGAPRTNIFADEKYTGPEPIWDTEAALKMPADEFDHHMRRSFNYYNYYYSQKDCLKNVVKYLHEVGFTPVETKRFVRGNMQFLPMTACSLVRAHEKGMPLKKQHVEYIQKCANAVIASATKEEPLAEEKGKGKVKAKVFNIQERLAEKTAEVIGELEGEVDAVFHDEPTEMNIYEFLTARNVPQSQIGKIRTCFQKQIDEVAEAIDSACKIKDLKEGYSYLKKKDIARVAEFYSKLMADLDAYAQAKKVTKKSRVKKAPSKEKLIAKAKYMKESKELKLFSIPLVEVIGATEVWVYHTKYRKLGKYVADDHSVLGIKGTSITGFHKTQSVAKTLRKPVEQLKEFMKANKVALRTFLKNIRATEARLNGRLNADILVLKAS